MARKMQLYFVTKKLPLRAECRWKASPEERGKKAALLETWTDQLTNQAYQKVLIV